MTRRRFACALEGLRTRPALPSRQPSTSALHTEIYVRNARVDDVGKQEERDRQPERDLNELPTRKPEIFAAAKLVECE